MDLKIISPSDSLWIETLSDIRHDIYHRPDYVILEAQRTKTLPEAAVIRDGNKVFFVPYLLRSCSEVFTSEFGVADIFDVLSPYGYSSVLINDAGMQEPGFPNAALSTLKTTFYHRNICSAFFRFHPILSEQFIEVFREGTFSNNGRTVSVDLKVTNLWSQTRKGHRSTINKCKRLGMVAKMVPFEEHLDDFVSIYHETMDRVSATPGYYSFDTPYFKQMNDTLGASLHLCIVEYEDQATCAGLYTECCGIVQSTLGGTRNQYLHLSPGSLETDFARYWAQERGNEFLHLGGGVGGSTEDQLYTFKSGFSKLSHPFFTLRMVIDEAKYDYLINLRAKSLKVETSKLLQSGFFPAYRSH